MSVKRLILLLALALMVVSVSAQDATTVKIFTSWPLTGGTQAVGESMLKAVELALEHYMADHEGMGPGGIAIELLTTPVNCIAMQSFILVLSTLESGWRK